MMRRSPASQSRVHGHHTKSPDRTPFMRWLIMSLGVLGVLMAINQQFLLNIAGFQPLGNAYLYYLIGLFLAISFLAMPISDRLVGRFQWINLLLAALAIVSGGWLGWHGLEILQKGWEYDAPLMADIMASILIGSITMIFIKKLFKQFGCSTAGTGFK